MNKYIVGSGRTFLWFTDLQERIPAGQAQHGRLIKVEVIPKYGRHYLHLTFENEASRSLCVDTGVMNFLAGANNIGLPLPGSDISCSGMPRKTGLTLSSSGTQRT